MEVHDLFEFQIDNYATYHSIALHLWVKVVDHEVNESITYTFKHMI